MDYKKEEVSNIQTKFEVPAETRAGTGPALPHGHGNGTGTINSRWYRGMCQRMQAKRWHAKDYPPNLSFAHWLRVAWKYSWGGPDFGGRHWKISALNIEIWSTRETRRKKCRMGMKEKSTVRDSDVHSIRESWLKLWEWELTNKDCKGVRQHLKYRKWKSQPRRWAEKPER